MSCRLNILPAADLGIESTKTTPPFSCLWADSFKDSHCFTSASVKEPFLDY